MAARSSPRPSSRPASKPYPTIDSWAHQRVVTVPLGDQVVDFKLPSIEALLAMGLIPNPLRALAEQVEHGAVEPTKLSEEDRRNYLMLQAHVIGTHLRRPALTERMSAEEAAQWVIEEMPPNHREILWLVAVYHTTDPDLLRLYTNPGTDVLEAVRGLTAIAPFRDGDAVVAAAGSVEGNGHPA